MSSKHRFRKPEDMPEEEIRMQGPRALLTSDPLGIYVRQSQLAQAINHRASRELQSKDFFEHALKLGWKRDLIEIYDDTGLTAVLGINDRERLLGGYLGNWKQDNQPAILDEDTFWTVFYHVSPVDIDGTPLIRVKRYEQTKTVECPVLLRRLLFGEEPGQHVVAYPSRKGAEGDIQNWGYKLFDQSAPHARKLLANLQASIIDLTVVDRLLELLHNEQALEDYHTRMQQTVAKMEKRKEQEREDLESIEKGLKGALRIMEDGDVDIEAYNEAKRKRKELLARKQRIEAELRREHPVKKAATGTVSPLNYKDLPIKVREKWNSGIFSIADKRQLLAEFLERVTIHKLSAHFYRLNIYWLITQKSEEILLWYPEGDRPRWTRDEEEQLKVFYPDQEKLMEALPTRTWASILRHGWEIGLAQSNPRQSRAAYMALGDLLTHQDKQIMVYYGVTLDDVSRGKPVSLLWSSQHDNQLSIFTNTSRI